MTISEGVKQKGNPYWIPNTKRSDLPAFFVSKGFKKGVEIGVSWAQNIIDYCEAGLEIYGVDPWAESTDEETYRKVISIDGKYGKTAEGVYQLAKQRTEKYPNCHLMRMTSFEAIEHFPDRSLDFVYIDGNHTFGHVAMDLMKWCRKVKKGGVIAGHDYYSHSEKQQRVYRGVGAIVRAFADAYDYNEPGNSWFVLGSKEKQEDEESTLSFMFIKN